MASLPLPREFDDDETYIKQLLNFVSTSELLNELCGGVHILDFFCQKPDIYETLFIPAWREWFHSTDLDEILQYILGDSSSRHPQTEGPQFFNNGKNAPPSDFSLYLSNIRRLLLDRDPSRVSTSRSATNVMMKDYPPDIPRHISTGMKRKKYHEVQHIAQYVSVLAERIHSSTGHEVSHMVDFGSGQNYLGRVLASEPYNKHVIGLESKPHNVKAAKAMDILAKLAPKSGIWRNKKEWRAQQALEQEGKESTSKKTSEDTVTLNSEQVPGEENCRTSDQANEDINWAKATLSEGIQGKGSVQYVRHKLQDGDLTSAIDETLEDPTANMTQLNDSSNDNNGLSKDDTRNGIISPPSSNIKPNLLVISLHSCGNLSHHGLRSLILNPGVRAIAIVGCCYNLLTDRLTPPSYKIPSLRPDRPLPEKGDQHGFPMSNRLCSYPNADGSQGMNLNVTARMMAVQAPQNWSSEDSDGFFTRHFYRALLQRIFVDRGIVEPPMDNSKSSTGTKGSSSQAIIIGSLRKHCYTSFLAYVRGALAKLAPPSPDSTEERQPWHPPLGLAYKIAGKTADLTDAEIEEYATRFAPRKKQLSIVWTLMAYSAGLVEAVIVVDRWLWLREQMDQGVVKECWVDSVFDYSLSPRNLVVCGIKK